MANDNKKYIPALRFPEFQNDGEWSMLELGKFAKIVMGQSPSSEAYNERGEGVPLLQGNADIKDRHQVVRVYTTDITKTCDINDIIMTVRAPVGTISRATFKSCIGRGVCAIKTDSEYLYQYLISIEQEWDKLASGSTFVSITSNQIFDRIIFVPLTIQEQKKIADCLSSLDKYIDAIKRKLELLKEHKKGLMQKLFPAKDKTTPELRFSEFKNDGEWVEKKVRNIFDQITRGCVLPVSETRQSPDDTYKYPVYSSQTANNGLMGYYNKFLYKNAITWTTDGANAGTVMLRRGEFFCTNVCGVLISHRGYANGCISEIIATHAKEHVSYVGNPKLMNNVMGEIEICIPPTIDEQIKIADCLYKVDQIISSHEKKIKSLELHKRGLIQQLFPKL